MQLDLAIVYDALATLTKRTEYGICLSTLRRSVTSMRSFLRFRMPPFFATRQAERRNRPWRRAEAVKSTIDPRHVLHRSDTGVYEVAVKSDRRYTHQDFSTDAL